MGAIVYVIQFVGWNAVVTLFVQVTVGAVLYIGSALVFKLECLTYLLDTLKDLLARKAKGTSKKI